MWEFLNLIWFYVERLKQWSMYSNKNHQYKSNKIWLSGYFPTVSLTASLRCRASLAGLHGFAHSRIFELHCNLGRVGQASLLINLSLISSDKSLFSTDSPDFPGHFSASCFPSRCLVIVMLWVPSPPPVHLLSNQRHFHHSWEELWPLYPAAGWLCGTQTAGQLTSFSPVCSWWPDGPRQEASELQTYRHEMSIPWSCESGRTEPKGASQCFRCVLIVAVRTPELEEGEQVCVHVFKALKVKV